MAMFAGGVIRDSSSFLVLCSSSFSIKPSFVFYVEEQFISISCSAPDTNISLTPSSQGLFIESKMLSISGSAPNKDFSIFLSLSSSHDLSYLDLEG